MQTILSFSHSLYRNFLLLLLLIATLTLPAQLKPGKWRAVLTLSEKKNEIILPFIFNVSKQNNKPLIEIVNADEKIKVTEIAVRGDSVNFKMPVFDSEFRTVLRHDTLTGTWINNSKKEKNRIPFEAYYNVKTRFVSNKPPKVDFSGNYEVTFNPKTKDEYKSVGVFKQQGNVLIGTFMTETGDYRYLEGVVQQNEMSLSCFDGAHAFLFFASSRKTAGKADSLEGKAFYGISGVEDWVAVRNEKFTLRDPESLTQLKAPDEKVHFAFPNCEQKMVSLDDERFANKPVIVQLMGSWCPNCMDETAYFAELYKKYREKGLEIIALAYERTTDPEKAKQNILRLKKRFGIEYEVLLTGLSGKDKASESLPFLNKVMAFPTTLILDRKHKVRSIYTGFSGPATGKEYDKYKLKTESLITELLLKK